MLETEELILYGKEAKGHDRSEAIMILNHKDAFQFILEHQNQYRQPDKKAVIDLHRILTKELSIDGGIRESLVGISGTAYRPLDNKWQIEEAIDGLLNRLQQTKSIVEQSVLAHAIIAYIQPFKDGNKRTSRMVSNAILIANDLLPLSYRTVDDQAYKKAMLLFYETNNLYAIWNMMSEQFSFTAQHYF